MIGKTLGHYQIKDKLGAGGMGEVFRALDTRLGRDVALKLLPASLAGVPEHRERFAREARAVASLNHPNVVTIHSVEEIDGVHFLTMELVDGKPLSEVIPPDGFGLEELLAIALPILDAVAAAHAAGVTHRDLKPANVLIDRTGRPKLLDFGLAKLAGVVGSPGAEAATMAAAAVTSPGSTLGTLAYMSPEQALGEDVDHRTDIFSLGAMLYEMATGVRPYVGPTPASVIAAILSGSAAPLRTRKPELPVELERIIGKCLEKDRTRRFPSAPDLRAALGALVKAAPSAGAAQPSVAVLPFVNMSGDPENEYFSDGMAEEIINSLCKIKGLRVAARTSSFAFKGKSADIREIGRTLDAETVLEGSVRRAGNRIRITVQLVKAADGYQLWSERFDREMEDVFAVQDEIAENVTRALEVVLTEREKQSIQKIPTRDIKAYDAYLRGRAYLNRFGMHDFGYALAVFQQATQIDPDFTLAWVGITEVGYWLYEWIDHSAAVLDIADRASARALASGPDVAEAHLARGMYAFLTRDYDEAEREFENAIRLDPKLFDAHWFRGRCWMSRGDLEKAAASFVTASEVRPEDYQSSALLDTCLHGLGRDDEREEVARRTFRAAQRHLDLHPDAARAVYFMGSACATLGEREKALVYARRALEMGPNETGIRYNVACLLLHLGQHDEALDLIEQNVATGWGSYDWIRNDPDMNPVKDHPRFARILETLRNRQGAGGPAENP
jgi:non-specific serine/threonine protein kinase